MSHDRRVRGGVGAEIVLEHQTKTLNGIAAKPVVSDMCFARSF